jgi:hypothetical protein
MYVWFRSVAAVFVGVLAVFVLSMGTDQMLHQWGFYPPWDQGTHDPFQNLVALTYRCAYAVLGGYIVAKFAPRNPMAHAFAFGLIGFVLASIGFFATRKLDLGPAWYPLALIGTAIPCAWVGATLQRILMERAIEKRAAAR